MHFLFPTDPLNHRRIDEYFVPQRSALLELGHTASLVSEAVLAGQSPLEGIPSRAVVVYRGWMLGSGQYERLTAAVESSGAEPLTTLTQYLATHYLPTWYPLLAEFTPLTNVYPESADLTAELTRLSWSRYFIKDYVKSLKTSVGSVISKPSQIERVVAEMRRYRGEIEGGICVREFEQFLPDSERRYFVLRGRAFSPEPSCTVPALVLTASQRISSPFFTVDVARREDGQLRIVELGDGQVSDLVGWPVASFANLWRAAA